MALDEKQLFIDMSQVQSQEDLNEVLEKHDVSLYEVRDSYIMNELPDAQYNILMGREPGTVDTDGGVDSSSWTPPGISEEQMAEYEGEGITSEMLPGESGVADMIVALADKAGVPPEVALLGAGIVQKNPKKIEKATDGLFSNVLATPKMTKKGTADKRGTQSGVLVGEATKGGPGVPVGKPTKGGLPVKGKEQGLDIKKEQGLTKTNNGETRKLGLTDRNKELATAGTLTGALIANRGLSGNRDKDGNLIPATIGKSYSGKAGFENYPVEGHPELQDPIREVVEEAPKEERPGWFKPEGSNFWSVKTDSPHWQTDEGAEEAVGIYGELPSWAKQPEVKEFDFSNWF